MNPVDTSGRKRAPKINVQTARLEKKLKEESENAEDSLKSESEGDNFKLIG